MADVVRMGVVGAGSIAIRGIPREQDNTMPCDTMQLGEPRGPVAPVVHRENGQCRVKCGIWPRQVFSNRLDHGRRAGWPLMNHGERWLHRHYL